MQRMFLFLLLQIPLTRQLLAHLGQYRRMIKLRDHLLILPIVLFVLVFVSVLLRTGRRLTTKQGRMEFVGYKKARQLECPKCKEMVFQHELIKHLIIDHDIEALDAAEITGKVMRRTWSEEE